MLCERAFPLAPLKNNSHLWVVFVYKRQTTACRSSEKRMKDMQWYRKSTELETERRTALEASQHDGTVVLTLGIVSRRKRWAFGRRGYGRDAGASLQGSGANQKLVAGIQIPDELRIDGTRLLVIDRHVGVAIFRVVPRMVGDDELGAAADFTHSDVQKR